ncbi:hypothetical protein AB0M80_09000 [Amycolatopsis sp. NPDC051045]|uniref:hypothetical protein n=1 Tax=Amycolatopsis sp. NPDC051045 TaxID=3156922 RepID=UPI00343D33D3
MAEVYCLGEARVGGRSLILAGGSEAGVWDAETLANIATFTPDQGRVWSVTACELGERTAIFGGTENGELYAWALGEESHARVLRHDDGVRIWDESELA